MRYILLIILFTGLTGVFAQTHNPVVPSEECNVIVKVITPLLIENDQGSGDDKIPAVVKGTSRTFSAGEILHLFKLTKEPGYKVNFTLSVPPVKDGVEIDAAWHWFTEQPTYEFTAAGPPLEGNWSLKTNHRYVWMALVVYGVDATGAEVTPGIKTYTATCSGHYSDL